jgi:hypothetical protein
MKYKQTCYRVNCHLADSWTLAAVQHQTVTSPLLLLLLLVMLLLLLLPPLRLNVTREQ